MRNVFSIIFTVFLLIPLANGMLGELEPSADQPNRDAIPAAYKWDLSLYYDSWDEWEQDFARTENLFTALASYRGRLSEGPEVLKELMVLSDEGGMLLWKVFGYAAKWRDLDTRDNLAQAKFGQLLQMWSRIGPMMAWLEPEILTIPRDTMVAWIDGDPGLEPYRFGLMDTYRTGEYTLDEAGERLLRLHGIVRGAPGRIYGALTDSDGDRPVVKLSSGEEITVTAGIYGNALNQYEDPADRRAIQLAWMEQFDKRRNTFASIYDGVIQQNWALAQSRGYPNSLEMHLNADNIPVEVVHSLVETAKKGAVELQRYHKLRQRFMGLADYGWSDMFIPLLPNKDEFEYHDIVPLIVESVEPLGEEYQSKMAEQFASGYVDVYETPGKRSGAYNSGTFGVGSFVLLNYHKGLEDVFTVAHEMGHSMHTRLSQEYQPFSTHHYTIFVAEVASTLNEKLLLQKLLKEMIQPEQRIAFIEKQLSQIAGTYFLQTMMADFEIQAHSILENGEGLTSDRLTSLWQSIVSDYFGDVIDEEDPYMRSWARIPHLYNSPFYVYQYATCYASSSYLMKRMSEDPTVVDDYLKLLKSGGNDYPMEQLKKAGVDLTDEEILSAVTEEFGRLVDLLEMEYTRYLEKTRSG